MSLRLRLTLLIGVLTAAVLLGFALVFYAVLQSRLYHDVDTQLHERAAFLRQALAATADGPLKPLLPNPDPLEEFSVPGIYAQVLASDGSVQAVSANFPGGRLVIPPELIVAAEREGAAFTTLTVEADEELRILAVPLQTPVYRGAMLVVAESLEPTQRTLALVRVLLLLSGLVGLALVLGGTTILAWRALTPIQQVIQTAARVSASGVYHERVPVPNRSDEVGELALVFNELIDTVERTLVQQRQLLADTSHELRSPLTVVLANLDLLRRQLDDDERELSIQEATFEAQRMRRLVNDLLLLAQVDAQQVIARRSVRLDRLVQEVVGGLESLASQHDVRVVVGWEPVAVLGDEERLTQLLRNLVENAIQHTPPGTLVEVRLHQSAGLAQIVVADNGPGIPQEHLPHIWDRFYRVDSARSREAGSSGLGLSIVKYIAEAHGGNVSVQSSAGAGCTFTVALPLAAAARR